MKFVFKNNNWWEVEGDKIYNSKGGYQKLDKKATVIEADDWSSLDWSCLLDRKSSVGWVAPDGTWFGCSSKNQEKVAILFLGAPEEELTQNGWVKVFRSWLTYTRDWYTKGMVVNKAQADTLFKKGFIVDDFQIREK